MRVLLEEEANPLASDMIACSLIKRQMLLLRCTVAEMTRSVEHPFNKSCRRQLRILGLDATTIHSWLKGP